MTITMLRELQLLLSEELDRLIALRTCRHEGTDWEFMEHTEVPSA